MVRVRRGRRGRVGEECIVELGVVRGAVVGVEGVMLATQLERALGA